MFKPICDLNVTFSIKRNILRDSEAGSRLMGLIRATLEPQNPNAVGKKVKKTLFGTELYVNFSLTINNTN